MINVAILGFGVVGSGVADILCQSSKQVNRRLPQPVALKYILDLRDFPDSPYGQYFTKDFQQILDDPTVEILVESIGGVGAAYAMTQKALAAGKSVVTSNKELVATHGYQLLSLAKEHSCNYLFEASVGGGIPVLRPLTFCLGGNEILDIKGILNGTTNYILTQMIHQGQSFDQALEGAQKNGYAEQDPTADVDGHDACRKICILANLAFGHQIDPNAVLTQGIRKVTLQDVAHAQFCGHKIKLIGRARKDQQGEISICVGPHLVPESSPLYGVEDVFNAVAITGDSVDETMFYGRGAGKLPTASAVVGDIIDLAKDTKTFRNNGWGDHSREQIINDGSNLPGRFYVRVKGDEASVAQHMSSLCDTILKTPKAPQGETAFLTTCTSYSVLSQGLGGLDVISLMSVLD